MGYWLIVCVEIKLLKFNITFIFRYDFNQSHQIYPPNTHKKSHQIPTKYAQKIPTKNTHQIYTKNTHQLPTKYSPNTHLIPTKNTHQIPTKYPKNTHLPAPVTKNTHTWGSCSHRLFPSFCTHSVPTVPLVPITGVSTAIGWSCHLVPPCLHLVLTQYLLFGS